MTIELKSAFIPADLHKWLRRLAVENDTTVQVEHEKALREAQALREQGTRQRDTVAVAQ
jgi:hypothetical protein